jgi:hypothetical protein
MIEAVNEKKMVSFRLSITLESQFHIVLAKQGVKGENLFSSFVEYVISYDEGRGTEAMRQSISKIIERARQIRESKHYRAMYDLQKKLKKIESPLLPPFMPEDTMLIDENENPVEKEANENNHKSNRARPHRKALRRA